MTTDTTPDEGMKIAWAADENYVEPMLASIRSAITHTGGELASVAVVSCGIRDVSKERIRRLIGDRSIGVPRRRRQQWTVP
jgi:lipopolysaccharide biosynthesis glycosyltransferase